MQIHLYNSKAENNRLDKTNYLDLFLSLEGYLREQTSIVNPSIIIELKDKDTLKYIVESNNIKVVDSSNTPLVESEEANLLRTTITDILLQANYCYIPDFKRYYFIKDIISVGKYLWRINMTTDSLMSYKDEILNLSCFVGRNEYEYNTMIKDDMVTFYEDREITETTMLSGVTANTKFSSYIDYNKTFLTISVVNSLNLKLYNNAYPPSGTSLPTVAPWLTGQGAMSNTYGISLENLVKVGKNLFEKESLASYVLNVTAYPFEIETTGADFYLVLGSTVLGTTVIEEVYVKLMENGAPNYRVISDFTLKSENGFLDYEPYCQYEIFLPYAGWVQVKASEVLNKNLIVYYVIDYKTASSQVYIYNKTDNIMVYSGNAQVGTNIPINTSNAQEIQASATSKGTNMAISTLAGVMMLAGGIMTANPGLILGGTMSGINAVKQGVDLGTQVANIGVTAKGQLTNANSGLYMSQDVIVRKTRLKPRGYNDDYFHLVGRPLNAIKTLKDLKGYTKVGECNVNIDNALDEEKNNIVIALLNGVYLEDK